MSGVDYETLRKRAEKRIKARQEFYGHLIAFIFVNIFIWGIGFFTGTINEFPWPFFVTGGWGLGLAAHGMDVFFNQSNTIQARRQLAIEREIDKEIEMLGLTREEVLGKRKNEQKAKHDGVMRLSAEGELVSEEEYETEQAPRKDRSRS